MKPSETIEIYSPVVKEAFDRIPELEWETDALTESIARRIDEVMKELIQHALGTSIIEITRKR